MWKPLSFSGMINPLWFNRVRGRELPARVIEPGVIELEGERLSFDSRAYPMPVGTEVLVRCAGNFSFLLLSEKQEEEAKVREQQAAEQARYLAAQRAYRLESESFNARIRLPVPWVTAIKPVLSGLTENSMGNGSYRNTVVHIKVLEDLRDGRLVREVGSLLCAPTMHVKDQGKFSDIGNEEVWSDGEGVPFQPKVTCKACLRIAQRYMEK